tara:strand:- start:202 stop:1011 length:810 start_codon:yes stop_codon:yes gene_type:complete
MSDINEKVHTSCVDCVFSVKKGHKQVGCELNRLEAFTAQGAEVVAAEDDDNEYFVVGRFCTAYRKGGWVNPKENSLERVKKEYRLRCGVMVVMNQESIMADAEKTILALLDDAEVVPAYIVVVNNSKESHSEVISRLHHVVQDRCLFYAVKIRGGIATMEEALDYGFGQMKNGYFISFEAGHEPEKNVLGFLNYSLNEKLKQILIILPVEGSINYMFTQCSLYKFLYGNNTMPFQQKIDEIAIEEGVEHMKFKWEDFADEITKYNNNNS